MGMPLKTVATSFKPNGNPPSEEIHGEEVGNYEVAQFFVFVFNFMFLQIPTLFLCI